MDRFEYTFRPLVECVEGCRNGAGHGGGYRRSSKTGGLRQQAKKAQHELGHLFRSVGIDAIQLTTDEPYDLELAKFFENREKRRARG